MYTPQIYSGTNVHANMPYCETRMKGLPTSIGVMCIHLPTIHIALVKALHMAQVCLTDLAALLVEMLCRSG